MPKRNRRKEDNLADWILSKTVRDTVTGCWVWMGSHTSAGYGNLDVFTIHCLAHRLSYELFVGPIPEGMMIDHRCVNPPCINPNHLRLATPRENCVTFCQTSVSAINARRTHCIRGHPFDSENTIWDKGRRSCRACRKKRDKERYHGQYMLDARARGLKQSRARKRKDGREYQPKDS